MLQYYVPVVISLWFIFVCNGRQGEGGGGLVDCPSDFRGQCGRCSSNDDPHIWTFDGLYYDQHTEDCFKYVTECGSFVDGNSVPFDICGCHYLCGGSVACIGDVSITFYDVSAGSPYTTSFEIFIDYLNAGNPATDISIGGIGALTSGNTYTFDVTGNQFTYIKTGMDKHDFIVDGSANTPPYYAYISYNPGDLEVLLSKDYFSGNSCGLCGYFDVDGGANDLTDANGVLKVTPADVSSWPYTPAVINNINSFANTYECNEPVSDTPAPSRNPDECKDFAKVCCRQLWNSIFAGLRWMNTIVSQEEFYDKWETGCIIDFCTYHNNEIPADCDLKSEALRFAAEVAVDTASKRYFTLNG